MRIVKFFKVMPLVTMAFLSTHLNAQNMKDVSQNCEVPEISVFPTGNENVAYQQYFSGKSWLAPLTSMKELNVPVANVTFEPGCRNNWHSHTGGQILIAVGGVGVLSGTWKRSLSAHARRCGGDSPER